MEILEIYPGLPGLFIACVYSAALSSVSSGINSLCAVALHDFIYPLYEKRHNNEKKMSMKSSLLLSKLLVALFGLATIGFSFLCQYLGSTVLQISLSIFGLLGGPLLGVISLGMFTRKATAKGALVGLAVSTAVNLMLGTGSVLVNKLPPFKSLSVEKCSNLTAMLNATTTPASTFLTNTTTTITLAPQNVALESFKNIFRISYYWFSVVSILIVFSVGLLVSYLTKNEQSMRACEELDDNLVFRFSDLIHHSDSFESNLSKVFQI